MTKIKNNLLHQTNNQRLAAYKNFVNPAASEATCLSNSFNYQRLAPATIVTKDYYSLAKASNISKSNYKPNLVFLQKKGSQIPNPNIISYNFPAVASNLLLQSVTQASVYKLLFNFFKSMYCLISKPVFIETPDKIKIQLFYFLCSQASAKKLIATEGLAAQAAVFDCYNLTKVYPYKFKLICTILSKFFNKNVELELIRLHQPYYNSNILVNFLALIINKKNIGACIQRLYNSNIFKANKTLNNLELLSSSQRLAYLAGLNIKISGRLMREPIIPRITTKKFEKGFTAKGKINYLDKAKFTSKNRKGAFTITVKSGQNF